jgi:hypothetical protein
LGPPSRAIISWALIEISADPGQFYQRHGSRASSVDPVPLMMTIAGAKKPVGWEAL